MKKVIVLPNAQKDVGLSVTSRLVSRLISYGAVAYIDRKFQDILSGADFYDSTPEDAEAIIVIGGDGSVIGAAAIALQLNIPLVGINLGRVGYLATVDPDSLDILRRLIDDDYTTEEHMLLSVEINKNGHKTLIDQYAVNDVILKAEGHSGLSCIRVENGRGDDATYRADGIILATPLGSTAYSLSASGPIVSHRLQSITMTPICPHSFLNRSIVYSPDEILTLTNRGSGSVSISLDGRRFESILSNESCRVFKTNKYIKMIGFGQSNLFKTLSLKIKLLQDSE